MEDKPEPKFISLKQAAKISGYSPDYIGYLIREGKVPGKPVYCNIAWMTTAEAVLSYKNREAKKKKKTSFRDRIDVMKLFIKTFRYIVPIMIVLILSFSALIVYLFSTEVAEEVQDIGRTSRGFENAEELMPASLTY